MNQYGKFLVLFALLAALFAGCTQKTDSQQIKQLPENAEKIASLALNSISGTFTHGEITLADKAYIIFDIQLESGSIKSLGIKDIATNELIFSVQKPQTGLYNSAFYDYKADSIYTLDFTDAQEANGTLTIYSVKDTSSQNQ